jgi:hypothetical protein
LQASPSRRTTTLSLAWVFHSTKPKTTWTPARSMVPGPAQIGLLVEARLDLDQGGDVLAVLGRLDQGRDDRAVLGGAVQGLFDGDDVRVAGGLAQELDHHVEALERVVDQDVLLADRREDVAAVVADALGKRGS